MYRQVEKHIDIAKEHNIPVGTLQKWVGQDRQFRDEAYGWRAYHGADFTSG
ncbi:conserved protein of unknown function [Paenibacillus alvei]|uniref:Uncharacterized protein n=1 Tax=Paenibacillus alvei TaxID=44250 RepID=A0A383R807_PAEAL|nr:conserved protein of unknown function [Paenibacillus alvei]